MKLLLVRLVHSLAFKVGLVVVLIELVFSALTGFFYVRRFDAEVDRRIEANVLRPVALMNHGLLRLDIVTDGRRMHGLVGEELINGYVIGINGIVFYSLRKEDTGQFASNVAAIDTRLVKPDLTEPVLQRDRDGHRIVAVAPLFGPDGRSVRFLVYIEASTQATAAQKADNVRLFVVGATAMVVLTSVVVLFVFVVSVFAPLREILDALQRARSGDLSTQLAGASARNELGALARAFNFMVTELQQMVENLRQERDIVAGVMKCSPVGIQLLNKDGRITFSNARAEQLLGAGSRPIAAAHDASSNPVLPSANAVGPSMNEALFFRQVVGGGQPVHDVEQEFSGADGRQVILSLSGAPLLSAAGEIQGVIIAMEDVTERRRTEEELRQLNTELDQRVKDRTRHLEAAIKELDMFAYSVSHDLRAPLRSIDGFSRILAEEYGNRLEVEGLELMGRIRAATKRMGQLIDDMLELSRHTRAPLRRVTVDLSAIAQAMADELRIGEPQRRVEFVVEPALEADVDPTLIRAVLQNLLGNAWKFTARRDTARIEFGRMMREGVPTFFVRDNGCGFNMQYGGRLFQPFQRLHSDNEFAGTGIGLANVQRIIRRHGGDVSIEGKVDEGATVYFTLPSGGTGSG
ncbi:MAG TPA: ATP-binding protein [Opitutaceae bacterium]|nr:ATP-binding protein [Opitutaceae bacterium]